MSNLALFEDDHLLVVNKPAGLNTHSPSPFAGEGIYEWLKNREPRWARLAIVHRLDKETSGAIIFGKTPVANRSLTEQFSQREVRKKYLLLSDRGARFEPFTAKSALVRTGEKYLSRKLHAGGEEAVTRFTVVPRSRWPAELGALPAARSVILAEPLTGKTHQIRVHAAEHGFPILGDTLYGGTPASRVFLHAAEISFRHPQTQKPAHFSAPPNFNSDPRLEIRNAVIDPAETNAFRILHGAPDDWRGLYLDRFADFLLAQSERDLSREELAVLRRFAEQYAARGVYHKLLTRRVRGASIQETSPKLIFGEPAPEEIIVRENGANFSIRFSEGYSVGIFLDQRENRRRLLTRYIAPDFFVDRDVQRPNGRASNVKVLNTFAYTCAFSVCAAKAGMRVTSLDLSKKYLDWGRHNFSLNNIDAGEHDFIFGDTFDWLRRFAKKGRAFDVVLLDPPTFSQSKLSGIFRAEKDYAKLVSAALAVLAPGGILFCSTNAAELLPQKFLDMVEDGTKRGGRKIVQQQYAPQPVDFPISRQEPAYLKTLWLRVQ